MCFQFSKKVIAVFPFFFLDVLFLCILSQTPALDVFSFGCVIYYALTKGGHPFGEVLDRDGNITKGRSKLNKLQKTGKLYSIVDHKTISRCISPT